MKEVSEGKEPGGKRARRSLGGRGKRQGWFKVKVCRLLDRGFK